MPATIRPSTRCSTEFGRAFILEPRSSRLLAAWLIAVHALAAVSVLDLEIAVLAKIGWLAALAAHAGLRWPRPLGRLVHDRNGTWALPDRGRFGLRLGPATRFGDWWVDLHLGSPTGRVRLLLLRDQVETQAWRRLQATLRQGTASPSLS